MLRLELCLDQVVLYNVEVGANNDHLFYSLSTFMIDSHV